MFVRYEFVFLILLDFMNNVDICKFFLSIFCGGGFLNLGGGFLNFLGGGLNC